MTLREMMPGNIQTSQSNTIMQLGAQTARKADVTGYPAFSDILGSKMSSAGSSSSIKSNSTSTNAASAADRRNSRPDAPKDDPKPRFLTYREANDNNTKTASVKVTADQKANRAGNDDIKTDKAGNEQKAKDSKDPAQDGMLQALAQILGLDMKDVQNLLQKAGITPESLSDMKNLNENVSKLSQLLGLDSKQQDTLQQLLQMAGQTLGIADSSGNDGVKGQDVLPLQTSADPNAAAGSEKPAGIHEAKGNETFVEIEPGSANDIKSMLEELDAKIKAKLDELGNRLQSDKSSVEADMKQLLKPLMDKVNVVKIQDSVQQADPTNIGEASAEPEKTAAAASDSQSSKNGDAGQQAAKQGKETAVQQAPAVIKETQPQAVFAAVQPDKPQNAEMLEKATLIRTPVEPRQIINQVIEKAKVVLTPDKSEMIMDLKPDSLGKISLKVVTENGMVMAKFVADSQQVKQVLESNMQLLKDSLERQGMNVQGFSVSVRQDSSRSSERWAQAESGRNSSSGGTVLRTAGIEGSLTGAGETALRNNPYTWGESTINLTA